MHFEQIKADFLKHMHTCGGSYPSWYVGITNDAQRRLFAEHGVNKDSGVWIFRTADSSETARRAEQYFISLGMDGGTGGGDHTAKVVYAYRKTSSTNP